MHTRLLIIFRAVAKHGSLAKAARELHLSPSALSHGLKALETEVGCRLFDRIGNKLIFNQAGEQLLAGIEGPLQAIELAAASVKELSQWGRGRLRIGASVAACEHLVPAVFRELTKEFPRLQLLLETGDIPHLVTLLRDHRIDLAIGLEPDAAPDLETHPLFEDEVLFVLSPNHPWNHGRSLTKEDIRRQTIIFYQRTSLTAQMAMRYFRRYEFEPGVTMEVASITAIKEMVKLNLGVAILAPWVVDAELSRGQLTLRPLGGKALRRRWVVAHLARRRLGLAEEKFCKICRAHTTTLRKDRHAEGPGLVPVNLSAAKSGSPAGVTECLEDR